MSEADKKRNRDRNARKTEKLMTLSKNFTTQNTKDVISNEVYKVKFWNKESKDSGKSDYLFLKSNRSWTGRFRKRRL